jgi:hypothetical protein
VAARGVVGGRECYQQHERGGATGDLQADLQVRAEAARPDAGEVGKGPVTGDVIAIQQLGVRPQRGDHHFRVRQQEDDRDDVREASEDQLPAPRHAPHAPHPSSGGGGERLFGDDVGHR